MTSWFELFVRRRPLAEVLVLAEPSIVRGVSMVNMGAAQDASRALSV
jgi:hypothetical protein